MQSYEESFKLFKEGISLEEIVKKRGLATSTLDTHFALMVAKKLVKVEDLLPLERIDLIKKGIEGLDFTKFSVLKAALPSDISYAEIKLVLASLGKYPIKPKVIPIVRAIKAYRKSNCFRKCFNHLNVMDSCRTEFTKLAGSYGDAEIEVREFFRLMNSGELKICKLPAAKSKEIIYWNEFEKMRSNRKDFWD